VKTALKIIGIVVAVLLVAAIALPFLINVNSFRPQIEARLKEALGRPVTVGNLSLSLLSGGVRADQLSIADDPKFSSAPFITARSLKVGVEMMPLIFSKQLNVTEIVIDQPEIALLRNQAGVWNFSSLGNSGAKNTPEKSSGTNNLNIGKLELTDGKISFGSIPAKRKPIVYDKVDISMKNFTLNSAFPVTASMRLPGGGSVKLDGKLGPINTNDVSLSPPLMSGFWPGMSTASCGTATNSAPSMWNGSTARAPDVCNRATALRETIALPDLTYQY